MTQPSAAPASDRSTVERYVLWRRLDQAGHEAARLVFHHPFWRLSGNALFTHEGKPCQLEYWIVCDDRWNTSHARITGWVGDRRVSCELVADANHQWQLNGAARPEVAGCIDLDLGFSPATNSLPILRLGLEPGQQAEVHAAWLGFPGFGLERLVQVYRRTGARNFQYLVPESGFAADLEVNSAGIVLRYPGQWEMESLKE